jgi:radical SAM superfamily enzyme YgiQ (UPF0313 family)
MESQNPLKHRIENTVLRAETPRVFRHVLCVYPYRRELNRAGFFPPLGLEYIAATIEPHAERINVVDLRKEAGRTRDFLRPETDLVCFSVNWDRDIEFLREEIRSVPPGVLTIVGGRHATEDPEYWLSAFPNVDAVVRGDGEEAVTEFCRGQPFEEIAGLSFRKDGRIYHGPNRHLGPLANDLYPNRRLREYVYEGEIEGVSLGLAVDSISSSRGCPFNCSFCSFNRNPWGEKRNWSARSPESVVEELAQMDAPIVGFTDDLFTHDMARVERICDLLLARGIRKKYFVNARLEIARHPAILRKMEKAGFLMLLLGIESAHDKTLRSMGKGFNTAKIREYFEVLRNHAMILHGYFILGNIGESVEEMKRIVPFAHELGVDTLGLSILRASPHAGLDELVANSPGYHIAESGKIYSDHCSANELRLLRRRLYRDFYNVRQVLRVVHKGRRGGVGQFVPRALLRLPQFSWRLAMRYRQRANRRSKPKEGRPATPE